MPNNPPKRKQDAQGEASWERVEQIHERLDELDKLLAFLNELEEK